MKRIKDLEKACKLFTHAWKMAGRPRKIPPWEIFSLAIVCKTTSAGRVTLETAEEIQIYYNGTMLVCFHENYGPIGVNKDLSIPAITKNLNALIARLATRSRAQKPRKGMRARVL